jgi:hypothetical protein
MPSSGHEVSERGGGLAFSSVASLAMKGCSMTDRVPTPKRLREVLAYDPDTGALIWKPRTGKMSAPFNHSYAGRPAGTLRTDGYIAVKVGDVIYPAHRIIWAMIYEEWPEYVRHQNLDYADNRLENLYASSRAAVIEEARRRTNRGL